MLTGLSKKIELIANLAIIVVACLLGTVLVRNYLLSTSARRASANEMQRTNSASLSALDIDWRKNKQTLLLAISSTCHFCTESAPFYKKLATGPRSTRLVAVLPQSTGEGRRYLNELGLSVDEVKQVQLSSISVSGTPTLLLVDSMGVVIGTWVGKLADEQQAEVLSKML